MKSRSCEDVKGVVQHVKHVKRWHPKEFLFAAVICSMISSVIGCNKALCASDVSKCLLQELCQCHVKGGTCPCCHECMLCLGNVWEQCCDCVGLCSKNKESRKQSSRRSSLEELPIPVPSLFQAVSTMQEGELAFGWTAHTLPVSEELDQQTNTDHILLGAHTVVTSPHLVNTSIHCTVLYFNPCMSMRRCHQSCESVGSSKYRWFHNGCCQCVGPDCHGYGSKEPVCRQCHP